MKLIPYFKKLMLLTAALIFFSLISNAPCMAANYYVDNLANGVNDGSSWSDAWKSFALINWSKITAGDTIFISGGSVSKTYRESLVVGKSGANGKPIVIIQGTDSGHDGEVIIDGQKKIGTLIELVGKSDVIVSNLTLTNSASGGNSINVKGGSRIKISNNSIHHTRRAGVFIENTSDCVISNNRMYNDTYVSEQTDGIYSQRNKNITFDGNHIVINNNHSGGHDDAIQSYLDNTIVVKNNYCEQNNNKTSNAQGIYLSTSYGTLTVYNNIVKAPKTFNSLIAIRLPMAGVHGIVVNNTLIGGKYGTLKVEGDKNAVIKNNIIWDYNGGVALTYNGSTQEVKNNITDKNPRLDSNFIPLDNSPALDSGDRLDIPFLFDINGIKRPQGVGIDIGACEKTYSSGFSLAPPRNLKIVAK